jgi:hypothetical protein
MIIDFEQNEKIQEYFAKNRISNCRVTKRINFLFPIIVHINLKPQKIRSQTIFFKQDEFLTFSTKLTKKLSQNELVSFRVRV